MSDNLTGGLSDRQVFSTKEGIFCEEVLSIICPDCGTETVKITTGLDRTFYGHSTPDESLTYCVVERYKDYIPDPLIFVQRVQGNNGDLNVSSVPRLW